MILRINIIEKLIFYSEFKTEEGYRAFQYFNKMSNKPTAIFCAADVLAMGIYKGAYEQNLKIPQDLSVVGFDNISYSEYMNPPLTTIHQDKEQIAVKACKILFERIENPQTEAKSFYSEPRLLIRNSTSK